MNIDTLKARLADLLKRADVPDADEILRTLEQHLGPYKNDQERCEGFWDSLGIQRIERWANDDSEAGTTYSLAPGDIFVFDVNGQFLGTRDDGTFAFTPRKKP